MYACQYIRHFKDNIIITLDELKWVKKAKQCYVELFACNCAFNYTFELQYTFLFKDIVYPKMKIL